MSPPPTRSNAAPGTGALDSFRGTVVLLVLLLGVSGVLYPAALTFFAQEVTPQTADGSLVHAANGTVVASELLGQNITNHSLFWLRPSLIDYAPYTGAGGEVPFGPSDPTLLAELNASIALYGLENLSAPLGLISPSASGLDPDITVAGAWVQIPRIAHYTGYSQADLDAFVNAHASNPALGLLGPPSYVNVIQLDFLLLHDLSTHSPLGSG